MQQRYLRGVKLRRQDGYDPTAYPYCLPAVQHVEDMALDAPVTLLVGENGTGKSTLLEGLAVACGLNPEGGSRNFTFSTRATHSPLYGALTLIRGPIRPRDSFFLRAESYYNVASEVDDLEELDPGVLQAYGGRSLHEQSHGESFLSLMMHRFSGSGLYLLDEPEAALSPMRQLTLLVRLHDLAQQGAQFIIATHAPILMAYPGAQVYVLSDAGIRLTPYRQTEHFQVSQAFFEQPERLLAQLFPSETER